MTSAEIAFSILRSGKFSLPAKAEEINSIIEMMREAILCERLLCAEVAENEHRNIVRQLAEYSETIDISSMTFRENRKTAYFSGASLTASKIEKGIRERE